MNSMRSIARATAGMTIKIKQDCLAHVRDAAPSLMMLPKPPAAAAFGHEFGQHDVAERQAEQQPQRIEHARHGQRHEHFRNDLPARCAERVGRVDVAAADVGDRAAPCPS